MSLLVSFFVEIPPIVLDTHVPVWFAFVLSVGFRAKRGNGEIVKNVAG